MSNINEMFAGACQTDVNCNDPKEHANPWMVIFIREGWFQNIVKGRWSKLDTAAALNDIGKLIDDNSTDAYQPVFNFTRSLWGTPSEDSELCEASRTAAKDSQKASAAYLKGWLSKRITAVGTIINNLQPQTNN